MEKKQFTFEYKHYTSLDGLSDEDRELADRARQACRMAFAPHSGFRVGAAARLASGRIISASNQESDVFPAGICAERALLFHHLSHHPENPITVIAIASDPARRECTPCGICRQTLADTEQRQGTPIRVMMVGPDTVSEAATVQNLLPFHFEL